MIDDTEHHRSLRAIASRAPASAWLPGCVDLPWAIQRSASGCFASTWTRGTTSPAGVRDHRGPGRAPGGWLGLGPGSSLLDVTCGPGSSRPPSRGGGRRHGRRHRPAAIRHAREITAGLPCSFVESDVRTMSLDTGL